jgi:hypothetical protein
MTRPLIAATLIAVAALSTTAATSGSADASWHGKRSYGHVSYYQPVVRHYYVVKPTYHKTCAVWTTRGHCLRWN